MTPPNSLLERGEGEDSSSRTPRVSPQAGLLPCPFCGDSALLQGLGEHNVTCTNCNVLTPDFATAVEAIEAWNRRCDAHDLVAALERIVRIRDWNHDEAADAEREYRNAAEQCRAALANAAREPASRGEAENNQSEVSK